MKKYVYIIFTFSGTIPSRIIRRTIRNPFSHVAIALNDHFDIMYSFARKYIHNPFNGGFVFENIEKGLIGKIVSIPCRIYSIEVTEEEYQKVVSILQQFIRKKNRLKYNYIGLLSTFLKVPITPKDSYFCSQFVSTVLNESHLIHLEENPVFISPKALECYLQKFKIVYEGDLKKIKSYIYN